MPRGLTETKPSSPTKAQAPVAANDDQPSFESMIIEAVNAEGAVGGATRAVIKKFITAKYPGVTDLESSLTAAIKSGTEAGTFSKGVGGKVVIAASGEGGKENDKPAVKEKVAPVKKEKAPKKEKVIKEKKVIAKVAATRKVPSRSSGKVSYNEDIEVIEEAKVPVKKAKAVAASKKATAPVKKTTSVAAKIKAVVAPAKKQLTKAKAAIVKAKADLSSKAKEAKKATKTSVAKKSIAPKAKSATPAKRASSRK